MFRTILSYWTIYCFCCALLVAAEPAKPVAQVVVVCHPDWQATLAPWIKLREAQGWSVTIIKPTTSASALHRELQTLHQQQPIRALLLVGDVSAAQTLNTDTPFTIPAPQVKALVIPRWRGEPIIATDFPYSDLDRDGQPELAIGRWPVDSREQLEVIIKKTLQHETAAPAGPERARVNLVAGVGGFGALTDAAIEQGARTVITSGLPDHFEPTLTFGSWTSPHCPDPRRFAACAQARLSEAPLFWVYIGHGQPRGLDHVLMPNRQFYSILECRDCPDLPTQRQPTIAIMLACSTGAFDKPDDCLAENLLVAPDGPVAIIASSRVAMPYGLSLFASEALHATMHDRVESLGQVVQQAKTEMVRDVPAKDKRSIRQLLDSTAALLTPGGHDARQELQEHTHLLQLFGDPCLRLRLPQTVPLQVPATVVKGTVLQAQVTLPAEVIAQTPVTWHWQLRLPTGDLLHSPPERGPYQGSDAQHQEFQNTYEQSLRSQIWEKTMTQSGNTANIEIPLPVGKSQRYILSVWATTATNSYAGSAKLRTTDK